MAKRIARPDFSKLETASLIKYARNHKLPENSRTKEDLVNLVSKHFNNHVVDEDDVLLRFVKAVQRNRSAQRIAQQQILQQQQQQLKKPAPVPMGTYVQPGQFMPAGIKQPMAPQQQQQFKR